MEMLDEAAWKRFDTGCCLFWDGNVRADRPVARRITGAREHDERKHRTRLESGEG